MFSPTTENTRRPTDARQVYGTSRHMQLDDQRRCRVGTRETGT